MPKTTIFFVTGPGSSLRRILDTSTLVAFPCLESERFIDIRLPIYA